MCLFLICVLKFVSFDVESIWSDVGYDYQYAPKFMRCTSLFPMTKDCWKQIISDWKYYKRLVLSRLNKTDIFVVGCFSFQEDGSPVYNSVNETLGKDLWILFFPLWIEWRNDVAYHLWSDSMIRILWYRGDVINYYTER